MYLKEIKTSGFKSFADKINLSLDQDITCIVGPRYIQYFNFSS
jgi:chromosome segregation ATPase